MQTPSTNYKIFGQMSGTGACFVALLDFGCAVCPASALDLPPRSMQLPSKQPHFRTAFTAKHCQEPRSSGTCQKPLAHKHRSSLTSSVFLCMGVAMGTAMVLRRSPSRDRSSSTQLGDWRLPLPCQQAHTIQVHPMQHAKPQNVLSCFFATSAKPSKSPLQARSFFKPALADLQVPSTNS